MRLRLAFALVGSAVLLVAACDDEIIPPRLPTKTTTKEATPAERRDAACKSKDLPSATPARAGDGSTDARNPIEAGGAVLRVEIEGATDEPRARSAIGMAAGDALTVQKTQDAIRHLYELGDYDDVRLEARVSQGVVLRFVLTRRAKLGEIVIHGGSVYDAPELENAFHAKGGAPYNPVAIVSVRATLVEALRQRGYADASLNIVGDRAGDAVDLCIELHEGAKITIEGISFKGLAKLKEEELRPLVDTDKGRINAPGGVLDQAKIDEAVSKMAEVLDAHGLAKGTIQTKTARTGGKVAIVFEVDEGPVILLRRYEVKGDLIGGDGAYRKLLSLKSRDPFSRAKLLADMQKISDFHEKSGHKELVVQPQTQADDKNNTVDVVLVVVDPKKATKQTPPPPPPPAKK